MRDLQEALEEISVIRSQLAQGTQFKGYGPRSVAATGILALAVAWGESWWFDSRPLNPDIFLLTWTLTAVISGALCCWEAVVRSQKIHSGFSAWMIQTALEQFVPAAVAGLLLTVVVVRAAPGELWMLPGLWSVTFSLGIFASRQFLPRPVLLVGLWYLVAGLICVGLQAGTQELSAWAVGIPFGIGQLLAAVVLRWGYDHADL